MSINILMVLQSDFPTDMRVEREAQSLIKAGHNVYLLCDNRIKRERFASIQNINVIRLPHRKYLHNWINIPIYPNPVWLSAIKKLAIAYEIDVIHVHDLPLALSSIKIGRKLNIPVILDLHENYPAAMELWYRSGIMGWTLRNPKLAKILEKYCLQRVSKIIVIDPEHKQLLIQQGILENWIYVVENTISKNFIKQLEKNDETLDQFADKFVLFYFGKIGPERDLEVALEALPKIKRKIPGTKLIIAGDGPHLPNLKNLTNQLEIENDVIFNGWTSFENAVALFNSSDICILPQGANSYIDNGIPNKLFQYMSFGKPIIASDTKAISRVVSETGCGEIFKSKSPDSFAEAGFKIYYSKNPYGENGKKAILEKYNWEKSEKNLLKLYSEI